MYSNSTGYNVLRYNVLLGYKVRYSWPRAGLCSGYNVLKSLCSLQRTVRTRDQSNSKRMNQSVDRGGADRQRACTTTIVLGPHFRFSAAMASSTRKSISQKAKQDIVRRIEKGEKQATLARADLASLAEDDDFSTIISPHSSIKDADLCAMSFILTYLYMYMMCIQHMYRYTIV